jgi:hypothetical protein
VERCRLATHIAAQYWRTVTCSRWNDAYTQRLFLFFFNSYKRYTGDIPKFLFSMKVRKHTILLSIRFVLLTMNAVG